MKLPIQLLGAATLAGTLMLHGCGSASTDKTERPADTDTVDPEDMAPEGDIVGSGFW